MKLGKLLRDDEWIQLDCKITCIGISKNITRVTVLVSDIVGAQSFTNIIYYLKKLRFIKLDSPPYLYIHKLTISQIRPVFVN